MSYDFDAFWLDHYRNEHKDKSDAELRQIVLNSSRKVTALPVNATPKMLADAKQWLAEAKACNAILAARNESRIARTAAIQEWKNGQNAAKMKAILNLPTGVTPNGHLVAAILEDEGTAMTAQEIAGWCDELSELEEADLQNLLDGLQRERIIGRSGEKYFLRQAVTESLYPDTTYRTVAELKELTSDMYGTEAYLILQIIEGEGHPLTLEEIRNELPGYSYLKTVFPEEGLTDEDFEWDEYDFERACSYLTSNGLLTRLHLAGQTFYYYPMIGSRPPMKDLEESKRPKTVNLENMTEVQRKNEELKGVICAYLAQLDEGGMASISDIMQACPELEDMTNQRVSAIVRGMIGVEVERVESERRAYFRLMK